jgi:hypothetical protein
MDRPPPLVSPYRAVPGERMWTSDEANAMIDTIFDAVNQAIGALYDERDRIREEYPPGLRTPEGEPWPGAGGSGGGSGGDTAEGS